MAASKVKKIAVGPFVRGLGRRVREHADFRIVWFTGHPEPGLLADLAQVIADEAPADTLDRHQAWTTTGQ